MKSDGLLWLRAIKVSSDVLVAPPAVNDVEIVQSLEMSCFLLPKVSPEELLNMFLIGS